MEGVVKNGEVVVCMRRSRSMKIRSTGGNGSGRSRRNSWSACSRSSMLVTVEVRKDNQECAK